jgi:integrase
MRKCFRSARFQRCYGYCAIALRSTEKELSHPERDGTQKRYRFTRGKPCVRDSLRCIWVKAMEKSGLPFWRMYETRHTFASWALSQGETPEWVARTLGHADSSMVYRTYSRYIPNVTRRDGSALEEIFSGCTDNKGNPDGHNRSHND